MGAEPYKCILADPAWEETGGGNRGAQNHYHVHSVPKLAEVMMRSPEWRPAESCHLWLWCPSRIHLAFELLELLAAGLPKELFQPAVPGVRFKQITFVPWLKAKPFRLADVVPEALLRLVPGAVVDLVDRAGAWVIQHAGLGQYMRHNSEIMIFCSTGKAMVPDKAFPGQAIVAPKREHSRKPDEQYARIEHVSPGPRLEMFARRQREGWTVWGNEV